MRKGLSHLETDYPCSDYGPDRCHTCRTRHWCMLYCHTPSLRDGAPIAFGWLLTPGWVVLCDDTGTARSAVQHLRKENARREDGIGGFFYEFIELLIAKDLHHLQGVEDRLEQLEDQVLSGEMTEFNPKMTALRKEITGWIRYYTQLDDMVCEFQENENGYFSESELRMFHMAELKWEYGYPAVILASALLVSLCLWIIKMKKF